MTDDACALVAQNGQVVNDLSDLIGGITGTLDYDIAIKRQLRLEIAGILTPRRFTRRSRPMVD